MNEQWPEYWVELFGRKGYVPIDCIRQQIWSNPHVEWWFAQNILLFAQKGYIGRHPPLKREYEATRPGQLALVHPRPYLRLAESVQQLHRTAEDIAALVPPEETLILVGGEELENTVAAGRRALPFLERDGRYWGNPPDNRTAIRELERLRRAGAGFLVFAWPAFWWMDHYAGFLRHLRAKFRCLLENDHLVAFDLQQPKEKKGKYRHGT